MLDVGFHFLELLSNRVDVGRSSWILVHDPESIDHMPRDFDWLEDLSSIRVNELLKLVQFAVVAHCCILERIRLFQVANLFLLGFPSVGTEMVWYLVHYNFIDRYLLSGRQIEGVCNRECSILKGNPFIITKFNIIALPFKIK